MSAYQDPYAQLRNGEVDILITWLAVAGDHALTRWSSVSLEAVSDFQHIAVESVPGYWFDHYVPELTPRGAGRSIALPS